MKSLCQIRRSPTDINCLSIHVLCMFYVSHKADGAQSEYLTLNEQIEYNPIKIM